jgi:hypothetical protein
VHVTDKIEWTMIEFPVVPKRLAFDRRGSYLLRAGKHVNVPESLPPQVPDGLPELTGLLTHHVGTELTVGSTTVPIMAKALR